mgnify:FL=1
MYQSEYEKALEQVKTAVEFAKDCSNINRCENALCNFERGQAMACLQDMIREYGSQIDALGIWVDGVRVVNGVPLEQITDLEIRIQLQYVSRHIPTYVLLREGEKELAKRVCRWVDGMGNVYR